MGKKIHIPGHGPVKINSDGSDIGVPGTGPIDVEVPVSGAGPATGDGMLFENGDFMLFENGDYMIYE